AREIPGVGDPGDHSSEVPIAVENRLAYPEERPAVIASDVCMIDIESDDTPFLLLCKVGSIGKIPRTGRVLARILNGQAILIEDDDAAELRQLSHLIVE